MDTPADVKQVCLDLSTAAIALFDLIEANGIDAPMDSHAGIAILTTMKTSAEDIRGYYAVRNMQRMIALGISPDALLKTIKER